MKLDRRKPTSVAAFLLFGLTSCAVKVGTPSLNPKPHALISLHVRAPSDLKVNIFAIYSTTSPFIFCRSGYTQFQNSYSEKIVPFYTIDGVNNYDVVPDRFLPGFCVWMFSGLSAIVNDGPAVSAKNEFAISQKYLEHSPADNGLLAGYLNDASDRSNSPVWICRDTGFWGGHYTLLCGGSGGGVDRSLLSSVSGQIFFTVERAPKSEPKKARTEAQ